MSHALILYAENIRPQTLGVSISMGSECSPGLREFCGAVGYDLNITGIVPLRSQLFILLKHSQALKRTGCARQHPTLG
jgi:hypothetical protein